MHKSRLWFNTSTQRLVQGINDGIAFVLADAVVQYAGYPNGSSSNVRTVQDQNLSNSSLIAAVAQKTYVGNQFNNFVRIV